MADVGVDIMFDEVASTALDFENNKLTRTALLSDIYLMFGLRTPVYNSRTTLKNQYQSQDYLVFN